MERFSLKYVDLLQFEDLGLDCLEIDLKLAEYEMTRKPVQLQAQIEEDGLKHIIQIVSPAEVHVTGDSKKLRGILTDVDTIRALANDESWNELDESLDRVHYAGKRLFFSLLKKETTEALDPEYEE